MKGWRKLWLLDTRGQPLSSRMQRVLRRLLPRVRRQFPALRDKVVLTDMLEEAGRRITPREERSGQVQKIDEYTWVTLRNVGISRMRRSSNRVIQRTVASDVSEVVLSGAQTESNTAEEIERRILLREVLERLTPDEQLVFARKIAGFTSEEIARQRGCSVVAVDTAFSRAKRRIRSLTGVQERVASNQSTSQLHINMSEVQLPDERGTEGADGE